MEMEELKFWLRRENLQPFDCLHMESWFTRAPHIQRNVIGVKSFMKITVEVIMGWILKTISFWCRNSLSLEYIAVEEKKIKKLCIFEIKVFFLI